MKKFTALFLTFVLVLSLAACGGSSNTTTTAPATTAPAAQGDSEQPTLSSFVMNLTNGDSRKAVSATVYENGTLYVTYEGDVRKQSELDAAVMDKISTTFYATGLAEYNGRYEYAEDDDGTVYASFSADYTDANGEYVSLMGSFNGEIPADFFDIYDQMDALFRKILADVPEYVPAPQEFGEIADADRAALDAIVAHMTLENADSYMITGVAKDENFAYTMSLPSDEGIESALQFALSMMAVPYELNIVTLTEGTDAEAIAKSFADNINWTKGVCNPPDSALIATKDNQVLCLTGQASMDVYANTVSAIAEAGWTTYKTLESDLGADFDMGEDAGIAIDPVV